MSKEYLLVRERTAPPCVFQAFAHPTSPCSVCSILQLPDCLTEQEGGEIGWANAGLGICSSDFQPIARFLPNNERMSDSLKK